jgi:hypothetical protein
MWEHTIVSGTIVTTRFTAETPSKWINSRSTHWRERRTESKTNTKNCDTRYMNFNQGIWKGW